MVILSGLALNSLMTVAISSLDLSLALLFDMLAFLASCVLRTPFLLQLVQLDIIVLLSLRFSNEVQKNRVQLAQTTDPQSCSQDYQIYPIDYYEDCCFCVSYYIIEPIVASISGLLVIGLIFHFVEIDHESRLIWRWFRLLSWDNKLIDILYISQSNFISDTIKWLSLTR